MLLYQPTVGDSVSLYSDVIIDLKSDSTTSELYRFEGGSSFKKINFRNRRNDSDRREFTYFSASIDHHKYYILKRLKQAINEILSEEEQININGAYLSNLSNYMHIKKLIANSDKLNDLYSARLICNKDFIKHIKENSFYPDSKAGYGSIERVDRRVFGGGYGISAEWRKLLDLFTYFKASQRIDKNSVLELISNMRKTCKVNRFDNIDFLVQRNHNYVYEISESLGNDFAKYEIIECLEKILEDKVYQESSRLGQKPFDTIKEIVTDYEIGKRKTLRLLDKYSSINR